MKKTLIRIITGIFLISLLVLCLHLGDIVFLLIFGAFFLITVREMDHLLKAMGKEIVITPSSSRRPPSSPAFSASFTI